MFACGSVIETIAVGWCDMMINILIIYSRRRPKDLHLMM